MYFDERELPLNIFVQKLLGNIMAEFSKPLKGVDADSELIEAKINRLHRPLDADVHLYP